MWLFGVILIGLTILRGPCQANANVAAERVFTENGRPPPPAYPSDEEIAEQLIEDGQYPEKWRISGSEYESDVDDSDAPMRTELETEKQEEKSVRKREGEEEFATFVDPGRLVNEKQFYHGHGFEKRARADAPRPSDGDVGDTVFIAVTTVCTAAAVFGLVAAAFVWHRVHKRHKAAQESEYPHYGITGPTKERSGSTSPVAVMDAKLASSAQLYHYQHTKQQIIAMEQSTCEGKGQDSEDSEGEEDEGDFSVYEYPGLAPTGDIEVTNPLFENVASPLTKTDPKAAQLQPSLHQRFQGRSDEQ